jgi:bla regulator protein blaR1
MDRKMAVAARVLLTIAVPVAFGIVRGIPMHGQILHPNPPLPSFEVATIKPWKPQPPPPPPPPLDGATDIRPKGPPAMIAPGKPGGQTTDRVRTILPVQLLIAFAYNVPFGFENMRVLGGPDWLTSDQYEFQAKIEDSLFAAMQKMTPAQQREQVDLMEQSLLADRFKLKMHFETREIPGYTLVIAKNGPKLTPAKEGEVSRLSLQGGAGGNQMIATATTLDQWVHSPFLSGRPIGDTTGLTGAYDFTLTWGLNELTGRESSADAPSLFTAIQEQLGLKLVPSKVPVEVIVIDHIEKPSPD